MKKLFFLVAALVLCQSVANAESRITSADFSLGYGAVSTDKYLDTWDDHWTDDENTPTTQGDFSFTPNPLGRRWGPYGPRFNHRVLIDGTSSSAVGQLNNASLPFLVPITASFDGTAPDGVSYGLELEITSISIFGCVFTPYWDPEDGTPTLNWDEVTPGHEATSLSVDLQLPDFTTDPAPGDTYNEWQYTYAENYTQLIWDPDDYTMPLASPNDSVTRTFDILPLFPDGSECRFVDGIEIEGRVHLIVEYLPGDADGDGTVDEDDASALAANWLKQSGATWAEGDFNDDGVVDDADATILAANWQVSVTASVPEPTMSVLLLALAGGLLIRFRR